MEGTAVFVKVTVEVLVLVGRMGVFVNVAVYVGVLLGTEVFVGVAEGAAAVDNVA